MIWLSWIHWCRDFFLLVLVSVWPRTITIHGRPKVRAVSDLAGHGLLTKWVLPGHLYRAQHYLDAPGIGEGPQRHNDNVNHLWSRPVLPRQLSQKLGMSDLWLVVTIRPCRNGCSGHND